MSMDALGVPNLYRSDASRTCQSLVVFACVLVGVVTSAAFYPYPLTALQSIAVLSLTILLRMFCLAGNCAAQIESVKSLNLGANLRRGILTITFPRGYELQENDLLTLLLGSYNFAEYVFDCLRFE